jgi:hypothetical protein
MPIRFDRWIRSYDSGRPTFNFGTDRHLVTHGFLVGPAENALVLSSTRIRNIGRCMAPRRFCPCIPAIPERRTHDHRLHGTTMLAALNAQSGTVLPP